MCKYCVRDPRMVARGLNLNDFSADALAEAVLRGEFGNGVYRMEALGARYDEVQALVDKKIDGYARRVLRGEFGNGRERKRRLGYLYPAIQERVNQLVRGNW